MNKRKPPGDGGRGLNPTHRRPSVSNLRVRATNVIQRKPGAMNVRPNSRRIINSPADIKRSHHNVQTAASDNSETMKLPKTRITPLIRSSEGHPTSQRLIKFPSETVKKLDNAPMFSPRSMTHPGAQEYQTSGSPGGDMRLTGDFLVPANNGYGDTSSAFQQMQLLQQPMQGQAITVSNQNVPKNQPINRVNQSQVGLSSSVPAPERQSHRPFVPNVPHGMAVRDSSPQKVALSPRLPAAQSFTDNALQQQQAIIAAQQAQQATVTIPQQQQQQQQKQQSLEQAPQKLRNTPHWKTDDNVPVMDYEKQPIGGRNAAVHRQDTLKPMKPQQFQKIQQPEQTPMQPVGREPVPRGQPTQPMQQNVFLQNTNNTAMRQNPQQMYRQMQDNIYRQQQMQQRAINQQQMMAAQNQMANQPLEQQLQMSAQQMRQMNQMPYNSCYMPGQQYRTSAAGMTSPQDVKAKAIPTHQIPSNARNSGYPMSQQNGWVQNHQVIGDHPSVKTQLKAFAVDLVGPGETNVTQGDTAQYQQLKQNEAQLMTAQQQAMMQRQPQMQYQQYSQSPAQVAETQMQQMSQHNNIRRVQQQPQQQTMVPFQPMMQKQQQTAMQQQYQQQAIIQHQQQQQQLQHQLGMQRSPQNGKKKGLEFSPAMIRDQEMLVTNMRQQRVPEDIMRRQFEALLCEQRKYLEYVGQREVVCRKEPVQRRISRVEDDQRPEWMTRITPPRSVYRDLEKSKGDPSLPGDRCVQEQRQKDEQQLRQFNQSQQMIMQQQAMNTQRQLVPPPQQLHTQTQQDLYQLWQQQGAKWQENSSMPSPPYAKNMTQQKSIRVPQQSYNPVSQQYSPQEYQQQQMQYGQQQQQPMTPQQYQQQQMLQQALQAREMRGYNPAMYQEPAKSDEPSSLLKQREYKKFVRPQKQNNGLQNAETVRQALEALKNPETRKGLEYVANLGKREYQYKLNGTQDPNDVMNVPGPPAEFLEKQQQQYQQQQQQIVSSNGLENTRNANNPAPIPMSFPKRPPEYSAFGHPRQNVNPQQNNRNMVAEKENGTVAYAMPQQQGFLQQGYVGQPMQRYVSTQPMNQGRLLPPQFSAQSMPQPPGVQFQAQGQQLPPGVPAQTQQVVPYNSNNPLMSRNLAVVPYKFESQPQHLQQMQQYYRNQQNLMNRGGGDKASAQDAVAQGKGSQPQSLQAGGDAMQANPLMAQMAPLEAMQMQMQQQQQQQQQQQGLGQKTMAVQSLPVYSTQGYAQMAQNKEALAEYLKMQQAASTGNNHGQPEIRQPKTIGGLTYLARKADYIPNPQLIAPDTLIASKFLQPSVTFN